ncbi:MAG: type II 3-dehydroquinate dehydratase [Parvularculales bacterium]
MSTNTIHILNGPNLNLLGEREVAIYGIDSLDDIEHMCREKAGTFGYEVVFLQGNGEGELVDMVHKARTGSGLIINAGAYSHTSVALYDALMALNIPIVEVHLSNPQRREDFRHHSYVAKTAVGSICGFGAHGYSLALEAVASVLKQTNG